MNNVPTDEVSVVTAPLAIALISEMVDVPVKVRALLPVIVPLMTSALPELLMVPPLPARVMVRPALNILELVLVFKRVALFNVISFSVLPSLVFALIESVLSFTKILPVNVLAALSAKLPVPDFVKVLLTVLLMMPLMLLVPDDVKIKSLVKLSAPAILIVPAPVVVKFPSG